MSKIITIEAARVLIADLRGLAKSYQEKTQEEPGTWGSGHCDGRAAAYTLAAEWLEELIPNEETDSE